MNTSNTKRKIAETMVGAAIGAAIAGPAGAVAGGLVGNEVAARAPHTAATKGGPKLGTQDVENPIHHAECKRILVPVDFSPPSQHALRFAREWAVRFGSEIVVLHVVEPINTIAGLGAEPIATLPSPVVYHEQARAELAELVQSEFPDSAKVSMELRDGSASDQISTAARELKSDLIIMATHGRTGIAHALLGGTAERVVHHAPCPVLTLR